MTLIIAATRPSSALLGTVGLLSFDILNARCMFCFSTWLEMEHQNKKNAPFDFTGWQDVTKPDCPTQTNAVDCGVFTTRFAEYLSRDADFDFTQDDMAYYRRRMTYELVKVKLMNE
eukprot:m.125529 g.125529  ORF g.125529 m.125529 type:complete len:116 (+) comp15747_c0_seq1:1946-2293(+)